LFGVVEDISTTQAIRVLAGYSYRHLEMDSLLKAPN